MALVISLGRKCTAERREPKSNTKLRMKSTAKSNKPLVTISLATMQTSKHIVSLMLIPRALFIFTLNGTEVFVSLQLSTAVYTYQTLAQQYSG